MTLSDERYKISGQATSIDWKKNLGNDKIEAYAPSFGDPLYEEKSGDTISVEHRLKKGNYI